MGRNGPGRLVGYMVVAFPKIKSRIEAVKARIASSRLATRPQVVLARRSIREMGHDDASLMAAAITYYAVFSLFPLSLGLLALAGLVLESPGLQQRFLDFVAENLPGSAAFVQENLKTVINLRGPLGIGAIVGLLWSASAVFGALAKVINRAYDIQQDRPFYIAKPRQIGMALMVLVLFGLSVAVTSLIQLIHFGVPGETLLVNVLLRVLPTLLSFFIFLLIYKFMPNCKTYWRYVWLGALVAAVPFETAKNLFVWYLESFASYESIYGPLTSMTVMMLWIYLSSMFLILGAEVASEYQRMKLPQPASGKNPS